MKRIEGFLDLDNYYKNLADSMNITFLDLFSKGIIKKSFTRKGHYWLNINGEEYYFKDFDFPYSEMLAYEVACVLGINAVSYDIAKFRDSVGTISKSFHKKDCKYISGTKILMEYLNDENNNKSLLDMGYDLSKIIGLYNDVQIARVLNNLEVIWQAIEYYYQKRNIKIDIATIMEDLVNQFIFNIIAMQNDGYPENWELEESTAGVSVVPVFDNELCFKVKRWHIHPSNFLTPTFETAGYANNVLLDEFLLISDDYYYQLFVEKYNLITLDVFLSLIKRVEDKIGYPIPDETKSEYIKVFESNKKLIDKVLNKYRNKRK